MTLILQIGFTIFIGLFLLYIGIYNKVNALFGKNSALQTKDFGIFLFFFCLVILIFYIVVLLLISRYAFKQVSKSMYAINKFAEENSQSESGDKNRSILKIYEDNMNQIQQRIISFVESAKELISIIVTTTEEVKISSSEMSEISERITQSISQLALGATEQAESTQIGSEKISSIAEMIDCVAQDMEASEKLATSAMDSMTVVQDSISSQESKMNENKEIAKQMGDAIHSLLHKSKEIGEILEVINDVAEQTNLLSLNAAIEAARAGENGKGFAVVSDEIGKLAERSRQSGKQIKIIVESVQSEIENTAEQIGKSELNSIEQEKALSQTILSIHDISNKIDEITHKVRGVSSATEMLLEDAKQTADMINTIASISEETAAGSEEVSSSVEEQNEIIQLMQECSEELHLTTQKLQLMVKDY
jgi:methyl-accepting chemotaxis protein